MTSGLSTYEELGAEIGQLVDDKNIAYGSSFAKAGDFLRLLYPNGLRPEQMTDALLLVRIFDKQMRIASARDAFGESPYADIAGYGLLGTRLHKEKIAAWQGSANGPDVPHSSKAPHASAEPSTKQPTTTSESEPPASATSQPLSGSSDHSESAPASTAVATVNPAAADRAAKANERGRCGQCRVVLGPNRCNIAVLVGDVQQVLQFCGEYHAGSWIRSWRRLSA